MRAKKHLLFAISLIGICSLCFVGPIPQDSCYHNFSDNKMLFSITNFWNVISNIPFFIIGALGMIYTIKEMKNSNKLFWNCFIFFLGISLTAIGSGYYHLNPTNKTLVWDRLPMTISFMAFFSIIIGDCITINAGKKSLFPFLSIGLLSIIYWQLTEQRGVCDLRFYALVQFLPIILTPLILFLHKSKLNIKTYYWLILLVYVIAKVFEANDNDVYRNLNFISGHTIKHIVASLAPLLFLNALKKRNSMAINS
jgi:hypothetical protein